MSAENKDLVRRFSSESGHLSAWAAATIYEYTP